MPNNNNQNCLLTIRGKSSCYINGRISRSSNGGLIKIDANFFTINTNMQNLRSERIEIEADSIRVCTNNNISPIDMKIFSNDKVCIMSSGIVTIPSENIAYPSNFIYIKLSTKSTYWHKFWANVRSILIILATYIAITIAILYTLLNGFGNFTDAIGHFFTESSGIAVTVFPFLSITSLSTFFTARWRHLSIRTTVITISLLALPSLIILATLWSYLAPTNSIVCFRYPSLLASSQYISPQELYEKATCSTDTKHSIGVNVNTPSYMSLPTDKSINVSSEAQWSSNNGCFLKKNGTVNANANSDNNSGVQGCIYYSPQIYSNFVYQANITLNKDNPGGGGLIFRASDPQHNQTMYRITLTATGYYNFFLDEDELCHRPASATDTKLEDFCQATMAHSIIDNQEYVTNTMTVIAFGEKIYLYINGAYVDQSSNDISSSGYLGVFANATCKNSTVGKSCKRGFNCAEVKQKCTDEDILPSIVTFSNVKVWKLW